MQNVHNARFQRAMLSCIQPSLSFSVFNFTGSTTSVQADDVPLIAAKNTTEPAAGSSAHEQNITVGSDSESVDITPAVFFEPVAKMKKAQEKRKAAPITPEPSNLSKEAF